MGDPHQHARPDLHGGGCGTPPAKRNLPPPISIGTTLYCVNYLALLRERVDSRSFVHTVLDCRDLDRLDH